jgi:hypothetical protein
MYSSAPTTGGVLTADLCDAAVNLFCKSVFSVLIREPT